MSIESAKILKSGKVLTDPLLKPSLNCTDSNPNLNMKSSTNFSEEINQSGGNSPTNEDHNQLANEERFNRLTARRNVSTEVLNGENHNSERRAKQAKWWSFCDVSLRRGDLQHGDRSQQDSPKPTKSIQRR